MFAGHLRKLKNIIKQYQHFSFQCSSPGVVTMKLASDMEESIVLLADRGWEPVSSSLPPLVLPNGLSHERQVYLHAQRKFAIVCAPCHSLLPSQPPTVPLLHLPLALPRPLLLANQQRRSFVCVEIVRSLATLQGPAASRGVTNFNRLF